MILYVIFKRKQMIENLINLANKLDSMGFRKEADILDGVLKIASNFDDEVTEEARINITGETAGFGW